MNGTGTFQLPQSGLAEDILGQYLAQAPWDSNGTQAQAAPPQGATAYHLVTFHLGREEFGVDIASVQEIIRATEIVPVPGAPGHIRGVINLRGKIIPVVDLRKRFGRDAVEADGDQRIVVVELGAKRLGMLVDRVSQVLKFSSAVVEEMPEEAASLEHAYIKGVGKYEDRLIIIIDPKRSLLHADRSPDRS